MTQILQASFFLIPLLWKEKDRKENVTPVLHNLFIAGYSINLLKF